MPPSCREGAPDPEHLVIKVNPMRESESESKLTQQKVRDSRKEREREGTREGKKKEWERDGKERGRGLSPRTPGSTE